MVSVLIIEDERYERRALSSIISNAGYEVVGEAATAQEGIELASSHCPDIVLVDIRLPGNSNGLDCAKVILEKRPDTKVLILTAFPEFSYARRALEMGIESYMLKPISPKEISQKISEAALKINKHKFSLHNSTIGILRSLCLGIVTSTEEDLPLVRYDQLCKWPLAVYTIVPDQSLFFCKMEHWKKEMHNMAKLMKSSIYLGEIDEEELFLLIETSSNDSDENEIANKVLHLAKQSGFTFSMGYGGLVYKPYDLYGAYCKARDAVSSSEV